MLNLCKARIKKVSIGVRYKEKTVLHEFSVTWPILPGLYSGFRMVSQVRKVKIILNQMKRSFVHFLLCIKSSKEIERAQHTFNAAAVAVMRDKKLLIIC